MPATGKVRRDEAAPARLVLQRVENILGSRRDRDPADRHRALSLASLRQSRIEAGSKQRHMNRRLQLHYIIDIESNTLQIFEYYVS